MSFLLSDRSKSSLFDVSEAPWNYFVNIWWRLAIFRKCVRNEKRNNPWNSNEVHAFALDHRLIGSVHLVSGCLVSNSNPYEHFSYLYHGSKCLKWSRKASPEPFVNQIPLNFHVDSYAISKSRYTDFLCPGFAKKPQKNIFEEKKYIPVWDFQEFILRPKLVIWEQNEKNNLILKFFPENSSRLRSWTHMRRFFISRPSSMLDNWTTG